MIIHHCAVFINKLRSKKRGAKNLRRSFVLFSKFILNALVFEKDEADKT